MVCAFVGVVWLFGTSGRRPKGRRKPEWELSGGKTDEEGRNKGWGRGTCSPPSALL